MILYKVKKLNMVIATNPKSGVTSTANLLEKLQVSFVRKDLYNKDLVSKFISEFENVALVFRNPYERAVSMYIRFCSTLNNPDKRKKDQAKNILKQLNRNEDDVSFVDFLEYLDQTSIQNRDIHYRPQELIYSTHCLVRTENFKEDMRHFFVSSGFDYGSKELLKLEAEDLVKNRCSKVRSKPGGDLSDTGSGEILKYSEIGFPEVDSFLNNKTMGLIKNLFSEEIEYVVRKK